MKNLQRLLFLVLSIFIIITAMTKVSTKKAEVKLEKTKGTVPTTEFVTEELKEPTTVPKKVEKVEVETKTPTTSYERVTETEERCVESVSETKQEIVTEVKSEYGLASEKEIIMLAKVIQAEAGGIPSDTERSCVAWTVLNHVDSPSYPNTIASCITRPGAFAYRSGIQVSDHNLWLARDVVDRWEREHAGETDVGRTLPQGYFSFWGDGSHNYFRPNCNSSERWNYSLGSPYNS